MPLWCGLRFLWLSRPRSELASIREVARGLVHRCVISFVKEVCLRIGFVVYSSLLSTSVYFRGLRPRTHLGCGVTGVGFGFLISQMFFLCSALIAVAGQPNGGGVLASSQISLGSSLFVFPWVIMFIRPSEVLLRVGHYGPRLLSPIRMALLTMLFLLLPLLAGGCLLASSSILLDVLRLLADVLAKLAILGLLWYCPRGELADDQDPRTSQRELVCYARLPCLASQYWFQG